MQINFLGQEWLSIATWFSQEQEKLRSQLEDVDLSPERTAAVRGELRLIKRLLALPVQAARRKEAGSADQSPFGAY